MRQPLNTNEINILIEALLLLSIINQHKCLDKDALEKGIFKSQRQVINRSQFKKKFFRCRIFYIPDFFLLFTPQTKTF